MSGLSRTPGKRVWVNSPPRVRIPPAPPKIRSPYNFLQGLFHWALPTKARMVIDVYFVITNIAALLIGLSKGGLPSVGMLAVPILSLAISPMKAAVLLLPIYVISDVVGVWLYRKHFSKPNLMILMPAGVLVIVPFPIFVIFSTSGIIEKLAVINTSLLMVKVHGPDSRKQVEYQLAKV